MLRGSGPEDERVRRAKYLDWCSARVAERFLELTPDEIYELAQRASRGSGEPLPERERESSLPDAPGSEAGPAFSSEPVPVAAVDEVPDSFRRIVEAVTQVLTTELALPAFEEWSLAYAASPEQYEEELLGFWREGLLADGEPGTSAGG